MVVSILYPSLGFCLKRRPRNGFTRDPMGGDPWEPKGSHGRGTLVSPRDSMGGYPWEPKRSQGRGPLGAQGIPWEGTLGSPRDPMGGDPWEPKGSHGRGPLGAQGSHGRGPLGAQGIPWEGTPGSPGTTEDQFGGSYGLQERFWRYSVMK